MTKWLFIPYNNKIIIIKRWFNKYNNEKQALFNNDLNAI